MPPRALAVASRVYAALLRALLPAWLRRRVGDEMRATFAARLHDAPSPGAWWRELAREIGGLLRVAVTARAAAARDVTWRADPRPPLGARMESLRHDLRHGARMLRRSPGLALLAATALALGVGSTTTMFSITHGILRDIPVDEPGRLVHVAAVERGRGEYERIPARDLVAVRDAQRSFVGVAGFEDVPVHLGEAVRRPGHRAERVNGALVSGDAFALLRVRPLLGRALGPDDDRAGAPAVVVLGHALWRDRYASDPAIVGRVVRVDGVPSTVVGVMPPGFGFPVREQLWMPLRLDSLAALRDGGGGGPAVLAFARLRDGASVERAHAEVAAIGRRLALAAPTEWEGRALAARPYREQQVPPRARVIFRAMLLVVSFVLLIAAANVASLLLARAVARRREIAVRAALGAGRARLARQLLAESLAVSAVGGALGVALAWGGVTLFNRAVGFELAFWMVVAVDRTALAFAAALVGAAALAAGLTPARQAARMSVSDALKDEGRGTSSFRLGRASRALVAGETALSCALLVVTGLMAKGVAAAVDRTVGPAPERVLAAQVELRADAYADSARRVRFYEAVATRLAALPGVGAAALGTHLPGFQALQAPVEVDGSAARPDPGAPRPRARWAAVSPGFFDAFGVTLLRGRAFAWSDGAPAPRVAVVNRPVAERHLPGADPIGRRVRIVDDSGRGAWAEVVGVAPELGMGGAAERDAPGVYFPLAQRTAESFTVAVRAAGPGNDPLRDDPLRLVAALRDAVAAVGPDVPVSEEGRHDVTVARASAGERLFGGLFAFFGLSALTLAMVGLFGLLSFAVRSRAREVGIRVALGGRPRDVVGLVLRAGARQFAAGVAAGLGLAALVAPQLGEALFTQEPHDWTVYAAVAAGLALSAACAALVPARRALRVSPLEAFRQE